MTRSPVKAAFIALCVAALSLVILSSQLTQAEGYVSLELMKDYWHTTEGTSVENVELPTDQHWAIKLRNGTSTDLQNVSVNADMAGLPITDIEPEPDLVSGSTYTWHIGTTPPDTQEEIHIPESSVTLTPGYSSSRSADQTRFDGPGTQTLHVEAVAEAAFDSVAVLFPADQVSLDGLDLSLESAVTHLLHANGDLKAEWDIGGHHSDVAVGDRLSSTLKFQVTPTVSYPITFVAPVRVFFTAVTNSAWSTGTGAELSTTDTLGERLTAGFETDTNIDSIETVGYSNHNILYKPVILPADQPVASANRAKVFLQGVREYSTDGDVIPSDPLPLNLRQEIFVENRPDEGAPTITDLTIALDTIGVREYGHWDPWSPDSSPSSYLHGPGTTWAYNWWTWDSLADGRMTGVFLHPDPPLTVMERPMFASYREVDQRIFTEPATQRITVTVDVPEAVSGGALVRVIATPFGGPHPDSAVRATILTSTASGDPLTATQEMVRWDFQMTPGTHTFACDVEVEPLIPRTVTFVPGAHVHYGWSETPVDGTPVTSDTLVLEDLQLSPDQPFGAVTVSSSDPVRWEASTVAPELMGFQRVERIGIVLDKPGTTYTLEQDLVDQRAPVIVVEADDVTLDLAGHTIGGDGEGCGIEIRNAQGVTLTNGTVRGFWDGVCIHDSAHIHVETMEITESGDRGMSIRHSDTVMVEHSSVHDNDYMQIEIFDSQRVTVKDNDLFTAGVSRIGVLLVEDAANNLIADNEIVGHWESGVHMTHGSRGNTVQGNQLRHNPGVGVRIDQSHDNTVGPDNTIAHNGEPGVRVYGLEALRNTITRNSIHDNERKGISLGSGGNAELPAPVVTHVDLDAGIVRGTVCANCTVEVFSDSGDEGEVYEGRTTADTEGRFTFEKGEALSGPHVTATGTDNDGNTSEFSLRSPTTCVVTSTADSGPDTLRACLENTVPGDLITFDPAAFPPSNPAAISLSNELPVLEQGNVTIDGSDAGVILDGSEIGTTPETLLVDSVGLTIDGGSNLLDNGDFAHGLDHWRAWDDNDDGATRSITTDDVHSSPNAYAWTTVARVGNSHTIYDTTETSQPLNDWPYHADSSVWITTTQTGTAEWRFWYKGGGVNASLFVLYADGHHERIENWFHHQSTWTEAVLTRTLSTDVTGLALEFRYNHPQSWTPGLALGSRHNAIRGLQIVNFPGNGIQLHDGAQNNTIGGDRTVGDGPLGQGNLISANGVDGVQLYGEGTDGNVVTGNFIGTDIHGTARRPNRHSGIAVLWGSKDNRIGGSSPGEGNLISGNGNMGISLDGAGVMNNTVVGNLIGTDVNGTAPLPNDNHGIWVVRGARHNQIGGSTGAERNVISGNGQCGISVEGPDTTHHTISGNYIGIDATGAAAVPNRAAGVRLRNGTTYNLIGGSNASPGGPCTGQCNLISGNGHDGYWEGVRIVGTGTTSNTVSGNYVGTDVGGTDPVPNAHIGIVIFFNASRNTIGGDTPGERNVINGSSFGVYIFGTSHNHIVGNYIGTDATGTASIGNRHGVALSGGASHNTIGGSGSGQGNLISGNDQYGVNLWDDAHHNLVVGNLIGTDASGSGVLGNGYHGVSPWDGAHDNRIGGPGPGEGNVISANGGNGVFIQNDAHGNRVVGNLIGTDQSGESPLGNGFSGIYVEGPAAGPMGPSRNMIGPMNTVAFNGSHGVVVYGEGALHNTITQNSIHDNERKGISLGSGGNAELPAPVVTHVDLDAGIVRGTVCANCTVEVFSDSGDEGEVYEGRTTADAEGRFTFEKGEALSGPHVTATGTDNDGNTSEFSVAGASIEFRPPALDLRARGGPLWATIELVEGWSAADIDPATVVLASEIPAEGRRAWLGDQDGDGVLDVRVRFDRAAVCEYLSEAEGNVSLVISGNLRDGTSFRGIGVIRVISPGGGRGWRP